MRYRRCLNETERAALVAQMTNRAEQWTLLLPRAAGDFCGKRITLSILKPYPVDKRHEHAPLSNEEIALLRLILTKLPSILATIEGRFAHEITPNDPSFVPHADKPRIWISRDQQIVKGSDWWTFCVGRDDDPEPHWYFEFKGLQLVDVYLVH